MSWLTDRQFFLLAVIFYGISTLYAIFLWKKGFRHHNRITYCLIFAAFIFHSVAMVKRGFSLSRCPVNNLYEAFTFVSWTIAAAYLVIGTWSRVRFLGAFASPILFAIGVFALMPTLDKPYTDRPNFDSNWIGSIHAALILLSCGSFGLGSVAGMMYLMQEHDLKFHKWRAIFSLLPPIERLDRVTSGLLIGGFILLTIGLSFSPLLMHQRFGVYFKEDPILFYSAFIWLAYLGLLVMRWRYGQGGRKFAWGAVGTFAFVMLTFWGFILLSPVHKP